MQSAGRLPFIKDLNRKEIEEFLVRSGFPAYRAAQIFDEIYIKRRQNFKDMTLLPKNLRSLLEENFLITDFTGSNIKTSADGSVKFLFSLHDGNSIETVFMPRRDSESGETIRNTLCISAMAGCPFNCTYCATGKMGFQRNLTVSEIVGQILESERILGKKITNVVFMGMGEPLLNYNNAVKSIKVLTNRNYQLISSRKITVSTAGIVKNIYALAKESIKVKLAVSLHGTTGEQREFLMKDAARAGSLKELLEAAAYYYRKTKMPLTYEYILFDGINDSSEDASRLIKISRRVPSTINIIPFNDISHALSRQSSNTELSASPQEKTENFVNILKKNGTAVNVRKSFGDDIEGACGQLALSEKIVE